MNWWASRKISTRNISPQLIPVSSRWLQTQHGKTGGTFKMSDCDLIMINANIIQARFSTSGPTWKTSVCCLKVFFVVHRKEANKQFWLKYIKVSSITMSNRSWNCCYHNATKKAVKRKRQKHINTLSYESGIVSLPARSLRLLKRITGVRHLGTSQCKPNHTDLHRKHPPFLLKKYSRLHFRKHKLSKLQPSVPLIRHGKDTVCMFLRWLKGKRNSGCWFFVARKTRLQVKCVFFKV